MLSFELADLVEDYVCARIAVEQAGRAPNTEALVAALDAMEPVRERLGDALGIGSELIDAYLRRLRDGRTGES